MIPAGTNWADVEDDDCDVDDSIPAGGSKGPWIVFRDSVHYHKPNFADIRLTVNAVASLVADNQRRWKERWFAWEPLTGQLLYLQSETLIRDSLATQTRYEELKACVPKSEWKKYIEGVEEKPRKKKKQRPHISSTPSSNPFDLLADS